MTDTPARLLADELLRIQFDAEPLAATLRGIPGHDHELADMSAGAADELRAAMVDVLARAEALTGADQSDEDRVTAGVIAQQAVALIDELDAHLPEYTITDMFVGPASRLLTFLPMVPVPDEGRAADYLARLRAVPTFLAQSADRHRDGIAAGRVPVAHLVRASIAHLDRYLAADADPLLKSESPGVEARVDVVADLVRPAFAEYRRVLADEVERHGRGEDRPGLCWLPDGERMYAGLAKGHTTTDRTPAELHQTGLDLISALAEEYAELGGRVFGTSDVPEVYRRMVTDPALRWTDADELLTAARTAIERAEKVAPDWFRRMPGQRCRVEAIPAAEAPGAPSAYYMAPSMDGLRPGTYYANTDRAEERDRFVGEVTAFHEAVPGHHFQLTIAQELTDLPLMRRLGGANAYIEGWGLYTERLAEEMGLYSDDVARLGMLAMDSLRAGRLVVDTGLHAKGWSRDRAVAFLRDNSPLSDLEIGNEVDRYTAYPGQALSYMVGRLEIQRLRAESERRLRERFDIRDFHDVVLGGGALPLTVLADVVGRYQPA